jgi:hypothetical protein
LRIAIRTLAIKVPFVCSKLMTKIGFAVHLEDDNILSVRLSLMWRIAYKSNDYIHVAAVFTCNSAIAS